MFSSLSLNTRRFPFWPHGRHQNGQQRPKQQQRIRSHDVYNSCLLLLPLGRQASHPFIHSKQPIMAGLGHHGLCSSHPQVLVLVYLFSCLVLLSRAHTTTSQWDECCISYSFFHSYCCITWCWRLTAWPVNPMRRVDFRSCEGNFLLLVVWQGSRPFTQYVYNLTILDNQDSFHKMGMQ